LAVITVVFWLSLIGLAPSAYAHSAARTNPTDQSTSATTSSKHQNQREATDMTTSHITNPLGLPKGSHQPGSGKGCTTDLSWIGKLLVGSVGAVISLGLAAPAGADPVTTAGASQPSQRGTPQDFLAAVRAAGITGTDPAMLGDGYNVCWQLWNQHASGTQVAAGLVRDYQLTTAQAGHFVLAAYDDLCPVPGAYDYWAYSTS
jgi:hypothetical protein